MKSKTISEIPVTIEKAIERTVEECPKGFGFNSLYPKTKEKIKSFLKAFYLQGVEMEQDGRDEILEEKTKIKHLLDQPDPDINEIVKKEPLETLTIRIAQLTDKVAELECKFNELEKNMVEMEKRFISRSEL